MQEPRSTSPHNRNPTKPPSPHHTTMNKVKKEEEEEVVVVLVVEEVKNNEDSNYNGKAEEEDEEEVGGRERLKRHREEVAGQVRIPKKWGQEQLMKDWIDFTTFDALLAPHTIIVAARDALVADARKARSQRLRIHSSS